MNIVILGAGSIGSLFGALLSQANDVTLVCRDEHRKAILENGLKVTGSTELVAHPNAVGSAGECQTPDVLFITVKSYDTKDAVGKVKDLVGGDTIVVSLQNGLGNLETISRELEGAKVMGCVTSHGARLLSPGVVEHAGKGYTVMGMFGGYQNDAVANVVGLLTEAGIETTITDDIIKEIWIKAMVNAAINPLATILRQKNGALRGDKGLQRVMEAVVEEGVLVAGARGIALSKKEVFSRTLEVMDQTSENRCSMLQDVERGRRTEVDQLNGAIVEMGKELGIETPVNRVLASLISAIEKQASR